MLFNKPKTHCKKWLIGYFSFEEMSICKIAYVNSPERSLALRQSLPAEMHSTFKLSSSVPQFVEIAPKGVTKGQALNIISKKLSILRSSMIGFGDQDNDIPLLNYVGCAVAMGNAPDSVKEYADFITATNDEDGVAVAIYHFLQYEGSHDE